MIERGKQERGSVDDFVGEMWLNEKLPAMIHGKVKRETGKKCNIHSRTEEVLPLEGSLISLLFLGGSIPAS